MQLARQRQLAIAITIACVVLTMMCMQYVSNQLGDRAVFTGWVLLVATASLYLLTLRKKWIQLKLGPVAMWLKVHVYVGSFASCIFLMHIGWPIRGLFESSLAACFLIVAASGIALGVMSRTTPRRLAALAVDHTVEQIPALQGAVASEAHEVAMQSSRLGEGATLSEFYQRRLMPYFRTPRGWFYRMLPNGIKRRQLLRELDDLERYLAERGSDCRQQLVAMVKCKDDLDYQYALQTRLQLLFTAHVALTWTLAIMVAVHVVLVYRFQGLLW